MTFSGSRIGNDVQVYGSLSSSLVGNYVVLGTRVERKLEAPDLSLPSGMVLLAYRTYGTRAPYHSWNTSRWGGKITASRAGQR